MKMVQGEKRGEHEWIVKGWWAWWMVRSRTNDWVWKEDGDMIGDQKVVVHQEEGSWKMSMHLEKRRKVMEEANRSLCPGVTQKPEASGVIESS